MISLENRQFVLSMLGSTSAKAKIYKCRKKKKKREKMVEKEATLTQTKEDQYLRE